MLSSGIPYLVVAVQWHLEPEWRNGDAHLLPCSHLDRFGAYLCIVDQRKQGKQRHDGHILM